jgi:hypothetical protein
MPPSIDLTGHVYARLTVIGKVTASTYPHKWVCRCECGTTREILGASLRKGLTQSCGCLNKEIVSKNSYVHGERKSRLYSIWHNMKQRCGNPKHMHYSFYGALGISVCPAWNEFTNFKTWADSSGYTESLTIDRIKGDQGYRPDNCRWADTTLQARNQKVRSTNTSGHAGVSYVSRLNKYASYLTVAYKKVSLGHFSTLEEAIEARKNYIRNNNLTGFPT